MKRLKYIISSLAAVLLISCERTIEIDLPAHEPKLTIDCHLMAGKVAEAKVSHSMHSMGNSNNFSALPDAEVVLFENNVSVDTLIYVDDNTEEWWDYEIGVFVGDYIVKSGKTYKVQVNQGNYETAYGETVCPGNSIEISEIDMSELLIDSFPDYWGEDNYQYYRKGKLKFKVSGPLDENLHYFLSITDQNEDAPMYMISNDPIIAGQEYNISDGGVYPSQKLYFSGSSFNLNTVLTIELNPESSWYGETDITDGLIIKLEVQNNDYFEFMSKLDDYDQAVYNPFAEMVFLPNNIEGGYGIVSARAEYEKTTD